MKQGIQQLLDILDDTIDKLADLRENHDLMPESSFRAKYDYYVYNALFQIKLILDDMKGLIDEDTRINS